MSERGLSSELPSPSVELLVLRAFAEAHWRTLKPKQRLAFQKSLSDVLNEMDQAPTTIRPAREYITLKSISDGANAWIARVMSDLVRRG